MLYSQTSPRQHDVSMRSGDVMLTYQRNAARVSMASDDMLTDLPTAAQVSMASGDDIFTDQPKQHE